MKSGHACVIIVTMEVLDMFQVGEKIFYPMHGVGIIEGIEEKEVLGEKKLYYIMTINHTNLQIMFPMEKAENIGVRKVVKPEILDSILKNLYQDSTDPSLYANQRYFKEVNRQKIKSGDIFQEAEVIRDLTRKKQKSNKLGTEDATMLHQACEILVSELMQVKNLDHSQAADLLKKALL